MGVGCRRRAKRAGAARGCPHHTAPRPAPPSPPRPGPRRRPRRDSRRPGRAPDFGMAAGRAAASAAVALLRRVSIGAWVTVALVTLWRCGRRRGRWEAAESFLPLARHPSHRRAPRVHGPGRRRVRRPDRARRQPGDAANAETKAPRRGEDHNGHRVRLPVRDARKRGGVGGAKENAGGRRSGSRDQNVNRQNKPKQKRSTPPASTSCSSATRSAWWCMATTRRCRSRWTTW